VLAADDRSWETTPGVLLSINSFTSTAFAVFLAVCTFLMYFLPWMDVRMSMNVRTLYK